MIGNFGIDKQFDSIKRSATGAVKAVFPMDGKIRKIALDKVWVEDNASPNDYKTQLKTKERNGTFGVPVYASLRLIDKQSGKEIDREDKIKLFTLPKITDRFSYIVGGNEYQVSNQLRRKSGVYTLRKQNGELKTSVNLAKGKNFDIEYDEDKAIFNITKVGGGQQKIPLYPVLVEMGLSHQAISKELGSAVANANKNSDQKVLTRAKAAFGLKPQQKLSTYFSSTKIDNETTKSLLGQEFDKVDGMLLLKSASNLLKTHLGDRKPDDPNSLASKELHSVEDFISERIEKNKNSLIYKVKRNIDNPRKVKLSQVISPGAFNSTVEGFFLSDSKSSTPEQTNPLAMISGQYKTTIMGEGGIQSDHAITEDVRNVHPTHYGFIDPVNTPESGKIGANLHLPIGVQKDGKKLKAIYKDKSGNNKMLSVEEAQEKRIAFPGQKPKGGKIKVMYRGEVEEVPLSKVDYYTPDQKALFSLSTNMVPFLQNDQGNRVMMAAKMHDQAISLKYREKPLVQVEAAPGKTMEKMVGDRLALRAPVSGTITKVDGDKITIKGDDGKKHEVDAYNNFHLNRKSFLNHETKSLKKGDKVEKGQLLADSNFTRDGELALGINLNTAYLPYKGYNFEDGIVITESAAEKLTSEHVYKNSLKTSGGQVINKLATFKAHYPNLISPANIKKMDEAGVIREGQKVEPGDILIAAVQKQDGGNAQVGLFSKKLFNRPKNISITWDKETGGVVQKVIKNRGEIVVFVQTEERAVVGDKLAGRHGNKGVITKIIPDNDAPKTKEGEPVDMLLNPHGIISRINIGQIYESAAAKAADKKGKGPLVVKNFSGEDHLKKVKNELKEAKISDKEELFDPKGKSLGKVHVGKPHFLKLFKQTSANFSAREGGAGQPYDLNQQPLKLGGDESPKTMDMLTMYSMLSHGARENLRETASLKSQQNDDYWAALKSGKMVPPPSNPFVFDKFLGYLKASGVDVKKDGSKMTLAPLTDKQVEEQSNGEVKKPVFYRAKNMKELENGFFDKSKFGGFKGTRWGHLNLEEPVVNPVFENAVKKITGLGNKYEKLVNGELFLHADGKVKAESAKGALTGGKAVEKLLSEMDVEKELNATVKKLEKTNSGSTRDSLNKKARFLTALKKTGLKADEAYIRKKMPVLPPQYRPLYQLPDGNVTTSDVNFLYQNVGILNEMLKQPVMDMLPEEQKAGIRKDLNSHMKAVSGMTDQSIKGRERKGFVSQIAGPQPKKGFFIDKVLSKQQDYAGRGTIIPEPELGVDEMGMPEKMAWKVFRPFIVKELRKFGKSPNQANQEIENKTALAKKALQSVMANRTVLLNRAPSLHKFSVMAFKPKLTEGKSIKIPPLVVKGFNADFDGDTMTVHTPISDEAIEESKKMFPSKNLYKPGTGALMMTPDQESQMGLYYLSKTPKGRAEINKVLGPKFSISKQLTGKETKNLLMKISKEKPEQFGQIIGKLKEMGEDYAYSTGFSLGIDDLDVASAERDKIVQKIDQLAKKNPKSVDQLNVKATQLVDQLLDRKLKGKKNSLYDMVEAGAKGKKSQLRSILASPLFVADAQNRTIPNIISKSYTEGLDIPDYWQSLYGARKGMIDRSVQTSIPGAYSKDIINNTIDMVISKDDCGTKEGMELEVGDEDIIGRYLARDHKGIKRNTLIDTKIANRLKKSGNKRVLVRSPLTCEQEKGVCAKCYGLDEHLKDPEVGDNVGAKAGQSIAEPLIQMTMNCEDGLVHYQGDYIPFLDLFEIIPGHYENDGRCETKYLENKKVPCKDGEVGATVIQKHMPDDEMYFIKTKSGATAVVQGNHPMFFKTNPIHPECDNSTIRIVGEDCYVSHNYRKPFKTDHDVSECFARDLQLYDAIWVDRRMAEKEGDLTPDLPGYIAGLYAAEGCIRTGNGTEKYEGVDVAVVITQSNDEIKDELIKYSSEDFPMNRYAKDIQVYGRPFCHKVRGVILGGYAWEKRLKWEFNGYTNQWLSKFLDGLVDGDGSVYNSKGVTIAKVYTSSYYMVQQIQVIAHKLGVKHNTMLVNQQKLAKRPQFAVELRFPENYKTSSVKLNNNGILPFKQKKERVTSGFDPVTTIKKIWKWDYPVYDLKTDNQQFMLGSMMFHNSFHTGGVAGTGINASGIARIDQLLKMPKVVAGAARLAPVDGIVTAITPGVGGGMEVTIKGSDKKTYKAKTAQGRKLKVRPGSKVKRGDALSEGPIKPQDLVASKGMLPAQSYMVNELQNEYRAQGPNIQKRTFETLVRSITDTTVVKNNPRTHDALPGDITSYRAVQKYNKNLVGEVPLEEAEGLELAKPIGTLAAGVVIGSREMALLQSMGYKKVTVKKDRIEHEPILKNITTLPILKEDWMASLGYRNLKKVIEEGASKGLSTDLHSYNPLPAYARGTQFGRGKDGKY